MIQTNKENILTIHLTYTHNSGVNDIETFISFLGACSEEASKPGFSNIFNEKEKRLIKNLSEDIINIKK